MSLSQSPAGGCFAYKLHLPGLRREQEGDIRENPARPGLTFFLKETGSIVLCWDESLKTENTGERKTGIGWTEQCDTLPKKYDRIHSNDSSDSPRQIL